MIHPICETCGTEYAEAPTPPARCPVCADERRFVGWNGQTWTTHEAARRQAQVAAGDDGAIVMVDGGYRTI